MEQRDLKDLLAAVEAGEVSPEDAAVRLRMAPFSDLGFAKVDHHRGIRQGNAEVIYGAGKTADQIASIVASMLAAGEERVLITRIEPDVAREVEQLLSEGLTFVELEDGEDDARMSSRETTGPLDPQGQLPSCAAQSQPSAAAVQSQVPSAAPQSQPPADAQDQLDQDFAFPLFTYYDLPKVVIVGEMPEPDGVGTIVVACGGTSDIYVAEEAALTAEVMGNEVVRLYDVGVAGLHRLLSHADELARARVVVAVAGMEGALPSVVGGLVSCPVIAVPTSVGYGASFDGLSALLAMLNSCASGVSVVNIDNGFGAGYQASLINHV